MGFIINYRRDPEINNVIVSKDTEGIIFKFLITGSKTSEGYSEFPIWTNLRVLATGSGPFGPP